MFLTLEKINVVCLVYSNNYLRFVKQYLLALYHILNNLCIKNQSYLKLTLYDLCERISSFYSLYESVDDRSLSYAISREFMEKII